MDWKKHATIAAACLLLIVSPIGAPAVGIAVTALCANDPWAEPFAGCGFYGPVEYYFLASLWFPGLGSRVAGPPIDTLVFIGWYLAALWLPLIFAWHAVRAIIAWRDRGEP